MTAADATSASAIPLWLQRTYLEELGGRSQPDGTVSGTGWQARLFALDDDVIGGLRVGRVRLELAGEAAALARLRRGLVPKLLRAGG